MYDSHCHINTDNAYFCSHEISIDRRFPDLETQTSLALKELTEAKISGTNSTLHCVQATQLMMNVLKTVKPLHKTVLWHSFNGSPETAKELYRLGVIVSISPKCTKDIRAIFEANPLFTLETDYTGSDVREHKKILENHYKKVRDILEIPADELERRCIENAFTS